MSKRIRKRRVGDSKLLSKPVYQGDMNIPTSVELLQYNDKDYLTKSLESHTDLIKNISPDKVNWFKVTGISDVEYVSDICKNFGLYGFDIRELLADNHVVKVVLYEKVTFALVSGFFLNDDGELEDMQLAFILGNNYVISFKESPISVFKDVEKAIADNNVTLRRKGADFLLYILLNTVNTMNNDLVLKAEEKLFVVEDQLIMQKETLDILHFLHGQRIAHMQLKRFMSAYREEYENLLENGNGLVKNENLVYFENLDDKLRTTRSNLDNFQEAIMSLLDLYYNNNNMKLNEIMKRLTLVSTIFIPLTFLVGVWGMNFKFMPELEWEYGYITAWIIFLVIVIIMFFQMRRKKWF